MIMPERNFFHFLLLELCRELSTAIIGSQDAQLQLEANRAIVVGLEGGLQFLLDSRGTIFPPSLSIHQVVEQTLAQMPHVPVPPGLAPQPEVISIMRNLNSLNDLLMFGYDGEFVRIATSILTLAGGGGG